MGSVREEMLKKYTTQSKGGTGSPSTPASSGGAEDTSSSSSSSNTPKTATVSIRETMLDKYVRNGSKDTIDDEYIGIFTSDVNEFFDGAIGAYEGLNYNNAYDVYSEQRKTINNLVSRSLSIQDYLRDNKSLLDEEYYTSMNDQIMSINEALSQYRRDFHNAYRNISQFESEEEYNTAVQQSEWYQQYSWRSKDNLVGILKDMDDGDEKKWLTAYVDQLEYDEKSRYDIAAGEREIRHLESILETYRNLSRGVQDERTLSSMEYIRSQYGEEADIQALISEKKQYLNQARHIQEGIKLSGVADSESQYYDPSFKAKSGYVTTIDPNPEWWQSGVGDTQYEWINNQNGFRNEYESSMADLNTQVGASSQSGFYTGPAESEYYQKHYDRLTSTEVAIYNYYYTTEGKEKAQEYLDSIQEILNVREANAMFADMEDKTFQELIFGVEAGLDQFRSGVSSFLNTEDDYIPQTAVQMASGMVREDLADAGVKLPKWLGGASLGQAGYDIITTSANMAPSIMASTVIGFLNPVAGQVTGAALMGASAAGNAYQEMLNLGYDKKQARMYSTLVGGAEAGLQYLLGGVGKLGGKLSGQVLTRMMNGVDNAFLRVSLGVLGSMASEGFEEGLTEILTPWMQNLTLYTDEKVNWSEVAYSTLLGALTAGIMEGPSTISGGVSTYNTGARLMEAGVTPQKLAEVGNTFAADTVAYQLAGRVNENTGAYTMGRLFKEIGATLTEQNVNDITNALIKDGMPKDVAQKNAKAMAAVVEGGDLSDLQIGIIEANESLAKAVRTTIIDPNATWFQRTKGYNEALMALAREKSSRTKQTTSRQENVPDSDKVDAQNKNGAEGDSEVDGIDTSPVKVRSISAIKDGKVMIRLDDGSEVSVKEADVDPDDGVRIETIAGIEGISASDANFILGTLKAAPGTNAQIDSLGAREAYKYGFYGFSQEHIAKHGVFANSLSESQRKAIYETGQKARQQQIEQSAPKRTAGVSKQAGVYFDNGGGNVVSITDAKKKLTEKQIAGVRAAQVLRNLGIGGDIYFFQSYRNSKNQLVYKDKNGKEVKAPNGWYSEKDGSIHIDLNAGKGGNGFVLFTLSHELTHFIEQWSPQKYKVLADFLVENYEKGQSMDKLVRAKQEKLSELRGEPVSYNEAYSEVIADSMEAMLADGNVLDKLIELKAKDNSLFAKMKQFFDNLVAKIRRIYDGQIPDSAEGRAALEMKDSIEKIQQLFAEALVEASGNFRSAAESVVEPNSKPVATEEIITDGAVVTDGEGNKYSIRSMKHDIAEGQMFEDLKTYCNWTQKQVDELRKNLNNLVEYMTPFRDILDMNETYDREGRRFSPYKPNRDPLYTISMDFSTLCSKRLLTQYVIENLQLRENRPMSAEEQMAIRDMLNEYRKVEKGLQVACAMCYVEAARLKSPKQITKWMTDPETQMRNYFADKNPEFAAYIKEKQADFKESRGYPRNAKKKDMSAKDVRELNKIRPRLRTQYDVSEAEAKIIERAKALPNSTYLTAGNLAALSESDPTIYAAYTAFVRTATRSKSLETDEPYYYGDSTRDNGNGIIVSDSFIESVNRENGMRFSSWSDWRIQHLLDFITAVIDNSVRGAAMHGYTKFGDEVRVLGKTGMMFNMSGVAGTQTGLKEDGSLSFSSTESIDANEAIQLREEFPDTAGLQCIGVGDDHIVALLRSDIIDYVIPYHTSGLNAGLRRMANIHGWKDYTTTQHAGIDKSMKLADAVDKEHWHEEPVFSEFFVGYDTGMTGIEAMRESADRYVQMCKDRGLKPKFEQFVKEDNYWKLLIDRKMINQRTGELIRQKPVTPTFDFDTIKAVVDKYVQNYDSGLEARALNHIVENWDSIPKRIRDLKKQGGTKAKKASEAVDTLANQTLAAQPVENGIRQSSIEEAIEFSDMTTRFSLREEDPPKRTIKAYKVFRVADGKLYPPKIANLTDDESLNVPLSRDPRKGKSRVTATGNDTPVGVWLNADVGGIAVDENGDAILNTNGRIKVYDLNGMKGNGDFDQKTTLAFRPGWHLGSIPEAIQFLLGDGTMPDDLVYAECEIAADIDYQAAAMSYGVRLSGKFVHADAGLPAVPVDGYYKYKTNPKTDTHPWYISGAIKVNRIIGDAERRAICAKEGITIAPRYGGRDIEPTDIWESGQPAVAKDLTPYKKGQKNYENESLLKNTLEKIKGLSAENPKLGYIQRELDFNSKGIIDEIEKAKLDVDALRSAYEKHGYNPYYFNTDEEVRYSDRDDGFKDYDIVSAVYDIRNAKADRGRDLVKIGTMPSLYRDLFGLSGDVFVSNEHLYQNMVSRKTAESEGRFNPDAEADYHELGEAKVIEAIEQFQNPVAIMESLKDFDEPRLVAILDEKGNDKQNLIAVLELYSKRRAYGVSQLRNHVLITIYEKSSLPDYIEKTADEGRILHIREGLPADKLASLQLAGKISTETLKKNVARFNKKVKKFKADRGILYSDRSTDSVSNRSLLANALESAAQNDIERNRLQEYRGKIDLINAEERKLQELNEKIKELSSVKGTKDTKAIRGLQFEAVQTANRINVFDKQLLRLEASKPLQNVLDREKKMAYQRAEQKGKEALAAYRERATKTQRQMMDRYKESRERAKESREKTAMRHKIQNIVGELNNLLLNGDKKRHVPESLKKAVADALALVNMDTVGAEERAAKYAALIAKETDPDKIDAYTVTMENILRKGEQMGQRLKELRDAYEEFQKSDDPDIANAYDPVIAGCLNELSQSIGNTSLRNMSIEQLSDVYDMYRMVLTRVRDANKTFLNDKKEAISNLASRVVGEVRVAGGDHKYRVASLDPIKKFGWNNLKPVYAFEHIGSSTLTDAFDRVRAGEDVWAKDVTEAREFYLDKSKKYGYDSWDFKKKYSFESASEETFELTLEQILSLYAYSKRTQAHDHLKLGGFVFDSNIETYKDGGSKLLKYKVNTADAHQITPEILADIVGTLTSEQMSFVDEMQGYLSTVMGAKGNEITMQMYGVKLFKEKFYFPLKSAKQFMFEQNEVAGEVKIKNSGFTNKVVANANNPVILSNFMDVWANHVNDMSMYHAFVLPLEDFNRIFNYNSPKKEGQPPVSVKGTIQSAYTPAAVNYVKQLITDLNGGARTDSTTGFINKMMGLFKKGSVFASASVVVQQPSAIARAAALVDVKYFIGPKVDHKRHKYLWDEVKQYAPVAIIKEMGYFDTNMGKSTQDFIMAKEHDGWLELASRLDVKGLGKNSKDFVIDSDYRDEVLSWAPAYADELAWCSIWEAVKRETHAKHPGMDAKSEPFLRLAGARFTEVITKTQVYDSVLSRSANMRSKDTGMKMATAFMAEPTTSINMVADALRKAKRGDKRYGRKAIGAVIASQILNSFLVAFVYAARDDDDEKSYWEKYISSFVSGVADGVNPATYIPFIKDIISIVQGYDVERSDMAVISDLWKAWQQLKKDDVSAWRKVEGFVGSLCQIFGLPVKNIMRDVRAAWQACMSFAEGEKTTFTGIKYAITEALTGESVPNTEQLYRARLEGDTEHEARVEARYDDEDSADAAVRAAIKDSFMDGEIDTVTARNHLITYAGMDVDDAHWLMDAWVYRKNHGSDEGYNKYSDFYAAVESGKDLRAVIQTYTEHGVKKSTLSGQITEHYKDDYVKMSAAERANIKGYLINAFELCGMKREDAEKKLSDWDFEAKHGFAYSDRRQAYLDGEVSAAQLKTILINEKGYEPEDAAAQIEVYEWEKDGIEGATIAAVQAYNEWCKPAGVPREDYLHIRQFSNNTENDVDDSGKPIYYSAVQKVMAEIDSLKISDAQKTAIAMSLWKESTVNKYKLW